MHVPLGRRQILVSDRRGERHSRSDVRGVAEVRGALPDDDPRRRFVERAFELLKEIGGPEAFPETIDFGL